MSLLKVKSRSELWSRRYKRGDAGNGGRVDLIATLCWPTSCETLWHCASTTGATVSHDQTGLFIVITLNFMWLLIYYAQPPT